MRTTVTLDPDVERLLRDAMRRRDVSFKQALNDAVRQGAQQTNHHPGAPFRQKTFAMGHNQEFWWDKALAMADAMEDEELSRKLMLGK